MNKKATIKFIQSQSDIPIVKFNLNDGTELHAIVDTGSETSIFDAEFVLSHKSQFSKRLNQDTVSCIGLSASTELALAQVDVALDSDKFHITDAVVANLAHLSKHFSKEYDENISISALIGSDALKRVNATIDYETREMTYDISCK